MTPATAAAVSLLERLRTLAETWDEEWSPGISRLDTKNCLIGTPEAELAVKALAAVEYYDAKGRIEILARLDAAIAALKGETT